MPHEVVLMRRIAELRRTVGAAGDAPGAETLRRELADMQQLLAMRLERLRVTRQL